MAEEAQSGSGAIGNLTVDCVLLWAPQGPGLSSLSCLQYETILDQEKTSSLQQVAYHTVNRRYREFLNLQTRLEEKADLRKFIKSE